MSRAEVTDGEASRTCAVEGCEPDVSGCGLLRLGSQVPLWRADELGCGWVRWLVEVFPYEEMANDA